MSRRNPWKKLLSNIRASGRIWQQTDRVNDAKHIDLTTDDLQAIYERQNGLCYWLGIAVEPESIFISRNAFAMSADRLDNSQGYTRDNVVITTRFANLGRGPIEAERFREQLNPILQKLSDR